MNKFTAVLVSIASILVIIGAVLSGVKTAFPSVFYRWTRQISAPPRRLPPPITGEGNKVSIESLMQIGNDGTSLALTYTTMDAIPYLPGSTSFDDDIVDNRVAAAECEERQRKLNEALNPCRVEPTFSHPVRRSDGLSRYLARYAANAILISPAGKTNILFDHAVAVIHGEFVRGTTTDYLAMSYADKDTNGDGRLTREDQLKLAVLNLTTLALRTIELPGSLVEMQSVLGRRDNFVFMVASGPDVKGRFNLIVKPTKAVSVNFQTGAITDAIDAETIAALQKQFDALPKTAPGAVSLIVEPDSD
jgi:hypothetical protein